MKKLAIALCLALGLLFALPACKSAPKNGENSGNNAVAKKYQCPMKCEKDKTYDSPGKCPKCGMEMKEVK